MIAQVAALACAVTIDLTLGEPPNAAHPVVWMGSTIGAGVRIAPKSGRIAQLAFGAVLALGVPLAFAGAAAFGLARLRPWPWASFVLTVLVLKSTFALRALGDAARIVRDALAGGSIDGGRRALGSLCSRDAGALEEPELVAATIESVAENASDSFVAPLFYFVLFGLPGAVFYRAVNTLDAMIGYRGRYEYLGKASARLDDLLNLAPARLTAALLLAAGWLARKDAARGLRVLLRDGARTESPNAGRPMATMAGLLGVELIKVGHYRLGDPIEPLAVVKIDEAWHVVRTAALIAVGAAAVALGGWHGIG